MLIRKKLTADEFSNPNLRYNPDCDCVEFSPDGGETWTPQPSNDPRTSDAYRLPPLTGDDRQCRAAEGMTEFVRQIVNQRLELDSQLEIAGGILGIIAFIPGFNVLYALILALATFAVTIAREALESAFTEDTYDALRCIFYCNIDGDGQMSQEQLEDIIPQLFELPYLANLWVLNILTAFGPVGMSDAGVALEAAADCDDCACGWCYRWDADAGWSGWSFFPDGNYAGGTRGQISGGNMITTNGGGSAPQEQSSEILARIAVPAGTTIRRIKVHYAETPGTFVISLNNTIRIDGSWYTGSTLVSAPANQSGVFTWSWGGVQVFNSYVNIWLFAAIGDPGTITYGTTTVDWIEFQGDGDNPFGEDNC